MRKTLLVIKIIRKISFFDGLMLVAALLILPVLGISLKCIGVKRCQRYLNRLVRCFAWSGASARHARIDATADAVALAARGPYRARCLVRAMTTRFLLACQGVDSELHVGVRKPGAALEAHAWIVCRGRVLNDRADIGDDYRPFSRDVTRR